MHHANTKWMKDCIDALWVLFGYIFTFSFFPFLFHFYCVYVSFISVSFLVAIFKWTLTVGLAIKLSEWDLVSMVAISAKSFDRNILCRDSENVCAICYNLRTEHGHCKRMKRRKTRKRIDHRISFSLFAFYYFFLNLQTVNELGGSFFFSFHRSDKSSF